LAWTIEYADTAKGQLRKLDKQTNQTALCASLWCRLATGVRFTDRPIMAARMGTTQSVVARIESGRGTQSKRTVQRFARAVGARAVVRMEPLTAS
jgi:hypothetical protein